MLATSAVPGALPARGTVFGCSGSPSAATPGQQHVIGGRYPAKVVVEVNGEKSLLVQAQFRYPL
jgi:hypothetical protein